MVLRSEFDVKSYRCVSSRNVPVRTLALRTHLWLSINSLSGHPDMTTSCALKRIDGDSRHDAQICTLKYITLWFIFGNLAAIIIYTLKVYTY